MMAVNQTYDPVGWYLNHAGSIVAHQRLDVLTLCHRLPREELLCQQQSYAMEKGYMQNEAVSWRKKRVPKGVEDDWMEREEGEEGYRSVRLLLRSSVSSLSIDPWPTGI
ncbi:hypothetical protein BHE74_00011289 [Ensete ventricosum]|nr:hypothetical protein GW17_00052465 [Ensete ventricosum]RWW80370.1 hypothetical protein BHE74_00011289 [Ensete ventricosum]